MIEVLVLAAGASSRFGGLKQIAQFRGRPLVWWSLAAAIDAGVGPVHLVLGHQASVVREELSDLFNAERARFATTTVHCISDGYQSFSRTLQAAFGLVQQRSNVLIVLADMPLVAPSDIRSVVGAWRPAAFAVTGWCDGRQAHPVLLSRSAMRFASSLRGEAGMRTILEGHAHAVIRVPLGRNCLEDVDTPADLERVQALTVCAPGLRCEM